MSRLLNLMKKNYWNDTLGVNFYKIVFLVVLSIAIAIFAANEGVLVAIGTFFLLLSIGVFYFSLKNLRFGVISILIISFFIVGVYKLYNFGDLSIAMGLDILILSVFVTAIIKFNKSSSFKLLESQVSILIFIWLAYNCLQFFNPFAVSRIAWFYGVRVTINIVLLYGVVFYVCNTKKFIRIILHTWLILALLAALYCLHQVYFGFFQFEIDWIYATPNRYNLLYNWGVFRKFSFLDGPMSLGIVLAYSCVLCFILLTGPFSLRSKLFYGISGIIMFWAMSHTGTRTATILLPVGFILFALLTLNKKTLIMVAAVFALGVLFVAGPFAKGSFFIMSTAFRGSDDASMNVRLQNQERIQPYIQKNPIGYGIGSTGGWGMKFSPNTFLGTFPPDSEYVRVAIELGWFGLLFFCVFLFIVLRTGFRNYLESTDSHIKIYYVAILTVFFMTVVAMYPQEAIRIQPLPSIFAICIALLVKMKHVESSIN